MICGQGLFWGERKQCCKPTLWGRVGKGQSSPQHRLTSTEASCPPKWHKFSHFLTYFLIFFHLNEAKWYLCPTEGPRPCPAPSLLLI